MGAAKLEPRAPRLESQGRCMMVDIESEALRCWAWGRLSAQRRALRHDLGRSSDADTQQGEMPDCAEWVEEERGSEGTRPIDTEAAKITVVRGACTPP